MSKKNWEEIERLKVEANVAKERLMRIREDLYDIDAIREANSLNTLIEKLEIWQNK